MENLAVITVALLFLAIPGYVARLAYFSLNMSRAVLPRKPFEDIYTAIIFSIFLHATGIGLCEIAYHKVKLEVPYFGRMPDIDLLKVYRISTGSFYECGEKKDEDCPRVHDSLNWVVEHTYQHGPWVVGYFGLVIVLGLFTGLGFSKLVWSKKWDIKMPTLFGIENFWLYRHTGRGYLDKEDTREDEIILTLVDALVIFGNETKTYSGLWMTFTTDSTGSLRDLVLLLIDEEGLVDGGELGILELLEEGPFLLPYSHVVNLQIGYVASNIKTMEYRFLQAYWG